MADCELVTLMRRIIARYKVLCDECCVEGGDAQTCLDTYPENTADMCGDGRGLLKEVYDATVAMIDAPPGECSSYLESDEYLRPDDPGTTDCLSLSYLQGFADWLDHIDCGMYKYAPCPDQCYYAPEGYFVLPKDTPEVVALLYRGVISWYFKWEETTEPGETAEVLDSLEDCPEICLLEYLLFAPANVVRETPFNMVIQAVDKSDGDPHLSYQPATPPTITLTSTDGADVITPLTVPITGWASGGITVACTISGGSVPAQYNIKVSEKSCPEGEVGGMIGGSLLQKTAVAVGTYSGEGSSYDFSHSLYDWLPAQETTFYTLMPAAQADFNSDTVLGGAVYLETFGRRLVDTRSYIWAAGYLTCGYYKYTVDAADKVGLLAAKLYARAVSRIKTQDSYNPVVYSWSTYALVERFKIVMTENPLAFASGAALAGAVFDASFSMQAINALQSAEGGSPSNPAWIEIPLDHEFIASMSGNDLYIWLYFDGPTDYAYDYAVNRSVESPPPYESWRDGTYYSGIYISSLSAAQYPKLSLYY